MITKDFLTRIFAQQDELVICVHKPDLTGSNPRGIFWNRGSFTDIDEAVAAITLWDAEPTTTVYFSVGSFAGHSFTAPSGRLKWARKQDQATRFKALALDLDIGPDKPYATQKEGWAVMLAALETIGLPMPLVVSSGRGIHCYWPLKVAVPTKQWVMVSTALRRALAAHNVQIDTSKIHDPSMVLRPVGTHNKKDPTAWKEVRCMADCADYDLLDLAVTLKPWFEKAAVPAQRSGPARSSIAAAVLTSNDVNILTVADQCKQVRALVTSGGQYNAAGDAVDEPMWRASLGMAKYDTDPETAVVMIAGQHAKFDLADSMNKLAGWNGSGPTTCATFEKLCPSGCAGCPSKGRVKSPATLSMAPAVKVVSETEIPMDIALPRGYGVSGGSIVKMSDEVAEDGSKTSEVVSQYLMHITGIYQDDSTNTACFRLLVLFPHTGWVEQDHPVSVLSASGRDFSAFVLNRQIFGIKSIGQQERLRGFLMDYLSMVQQQVPAGNDYVTFGWQEDGSFLCGEKVINSPTGSTERRLKGAATRFSDVVKAHGSKDEWIKGMTMLNEPGTSTIRSAVLLATAGILGPAAGNASMVVSIYSTETTTGKSLALIAANSLIGTPKELFMNKNDTANALFKVRGVLNNLPCTIDEMTSADDQDVVDLAYDLSQGREKMSMTKDRDLRVPVRWDGPTLMTTNISLHQKFEAVQANNDPLKARTMELHHHDRTFIKTDATGSSNGYRFFDIMAENNGWAFPELVEAVIAMGGPKEVWRKGEAAFMRKFGFAFEPQERYYRTGIISAWIMGMMGKRLGLFPFDVENTIQFLLHHVSEFRHDQVAGRQDVFDTIGQYLQEHNDRLIEVSEVYGSNKEQVRQPAPEKAVARMKIVYDTKSPVLPGSQLAINLVAFRHWLSRTRDGSDRIVKELQLNGALIAAKDRITMFKGCAGRNPGQAHCIIVNLNHPRFVDALTGANARIQSHITLAILQGIKSA